MSIDHAYAELGLPPGASESEVKASWRRLVSRWHPDRNASAQAAELMHRINGAYDRIRLSAVSNGQGATADDADGSSEQRASGRATAGGRVVRRKVRLSLEEATLGCTKVIRGRLTSLCAACGGQGVPQASTSCTRCDGTGKTRGSVWYGWLPALSTCVDCDGTGAVRLACRACEGQGKQSTTYQRTVRVPAGVRQGDVLSADGAGHHRGGFDGTLELHIALAAHQFFVPGDDGSLRCEMPVDGFAWIAEGWIDVPTLTGLHQMRLRRGRHVYRLRGQGLPLPQRGTARGDCVVTVVPTFPESLSALQQSLLAQLVASADTQATDGPLHAWQATLRAWDHSRPKAARAKSDGWS